MKQVVDICLTKGKLQPPQKVILHEESKWKECHENPGLSGISTLSKFHFSIMQLELGGQVEAWNSLWSLNRVNTLPHLGVNGHQL